MANDIFLSISCLRGLTVKKVVRVGAYNISGDFFASMQSSYILRRSFLFLEKSTNNKNIALNAVTLIIQLKNDKRSLYVQKS